MRSPLGGMSRAQGTTTILAPCQAPEPHSPKPPQELADDAQAAETLVEKLKSLAPEECAEVEDFIDFLKARKERERDEAARHLGEAFAKLDALDAPPLTPEEVQAEIEAARPERRARDADRR